ncbi:hypothetical protein [Aphanothece sacrum]|uniref:hypothetical protein n=1 Tax=Aphanothece sacrum TaxID=1122 RepID=UPI001D130A74|nr:hypothetical protein [Aphanothece sacrum]
MSIEGNTRGDFGIHFDANIPGTAGCLGIVDNANWQQFQRLMATYQRAGLRTIPLIVAYF